MYVRTYVLVCMNPWARSATCIEEQFFIENLFHFNVDSQQTKFFTVYFLALWICDQKSSLSKIEEGKQIIEFGNTFQIEIEIPMH